MKILTILNRVFDIRLDRTAIFALIKDNKKTAGFDVSGKKWHYYFLLLTYDKHLWLSKSFPSTKLGSMVDKHELGSSAGNNNLPNFKSIEKHFWLYLCLCNSNFN